MLGLHRSTPQSTSHSPWLRSRWNWPRHGVDCAQLDRFRGNDQRSSLPHQRCQKYEPILFSKNDPIVLKYIFSWLSMDLGVSTYFYDGLNSSAKVGLQFVFPLYLIFLLLLIVAVYKCGQWAGLRAIPLVVKFSDKTTALLGSKIVPVLATLLVFSYTKTISTVVLIYWKADIQLLECHTNYSDCANTSKWYCHGKSGPPLYQ